MSKIIGDILSGNIDASKTSGKFKLLLVLAVLSCVFNWDRVMVRPLTTVGGFLISLTGPASGDHSTSPSTLDYFRDLARKDQAEFFSNPFIAAKIEQPFGNIDLAGDRSGHFEKLAFRFMPFLIAHTLHLDQRGLYCLQLIMGLIFPILIWRVLFDATQSIPLATAGAVLINGLYVGCSFQIDGIFFDAFAYFFLLCAMLRLPRWASILFLLCASFTDERAVVAGCLVPLWHLLSAPALLTRQRVITEAKWLLVFLISYVALRLGIGSLAGLATGQRNVGLEIFRLNLPNIVLLVWSVFEGAWIIIALAAFQIFDSRNTLHWVIAGVAAACFAGIFLMGLLVGDTIRSQQYAFPLLLIAIAVIAKQPGGISPRIMWLAIVLTLISPVTTYLGMETVKGGVIYNMKQLKPGYIGIFGM